VNVRNYCGLGDCWNSLKPPCITKITVLKWREFKYILTAQCSGFLGFLLCYAAKLYQQEIMTIMETEDSMRRNVQPEN
jgi:hypothetical protein